MTENRSFTYDVSCSEICYYISYKMDDKIDAEKEMKIFKNLFVEYNLEAECWQEFNNRIDSPHAWDDFDYEICIYSVRK